MTMRSGGDKVVRRCERCRQPSLVLIGRIKGSQEDSVVFTTNEGDVAEQWVCQACSHSFEISLRDPSLATVAWRIGLGIFLLGILGVAMTTAQALGWMAPDPHSRISHGANLGLILSIVVMPGFLATAYGRFHLTRLARNPIAMGAPLPPIAKRFGDWRARRCTCGGELSCEAVDVRTFRLITTGRETAYECRRCTLRVRTESLWRSVSLVTVGLISLFFGWAVYGLSMRDNVLRWILIVVTFSLSAVLLGQRLIRLYARWRYPLVR